MVSGQQRGRGAEPGRERAVPCVGAIVRDGADRLLLVRRAHPPAAGRWSLPGGRIEAGEDDAAALVRELREETGLEVAVGPLVGTVEWPGPGGQRYVIADYACTILGGTLAAGDDAAEVRWVHQPDLAALALTDGLLETLRGWQVLAAAESEPGHGAATPRTTHSRSGTGGTGAEPQFEP